MAIHQWFAVNTYSGREDSVKAEINRKKVLNPLGYAIQEINVPKHTETKKTKGGKTEYIQQVTMPGYILIKMNIKEKWAESLVRNTDGVIGFVGVAGKPTPLSDRDVAKMAGVKVSKPPVEQEFEVGDEVIFIDGPFVTMQGFVEAYKEDKISVAVEGLFERTITVEVEPSLIKRARKGR